MGHIVTPARKLITTSASAHGVLQTDSKAHVCEGLRSKPHLLCSEGIRVSEHPGKEAHYSETHVLGDNAMNNKTLLLSHSS